MDYIHNHKILLSVFNVVRPSAHFFPSIHFYIVVGLHRWI